MTGRKVTRRASMRRKSMRSPSVSRSSGSKTPRSVASEPNISGMNSLNSSMDKLNGNGDEESAANDAPAVNDLVSNASPAASSTELLTSELAAIKIADSTEKLVQEEEPKEVSIEGSVSGSDEFVSAAEESVSGAEESLVSSPLMSETKKSKNNDSLSKLTRTNSKLCLNSEETGKSKSTDELVAVTLEEKATESKEEEPATDEAAGVAVGEAEPVASDEKKSCEKAAKCRCIIS